MKKLRTLACICAISWLTCTASAQTSATQGVDTMLLAGNAVIQLLDQKKAADIWDGASKTAKDAITQEAFVSRIQETQKTLGVVKSRNWMAIRRQNVPPGGIAPAGTYITVEYETVFGADKTARELVSFRLEEDGLWRFAGYALQ